MINSLFPVPNLKKESHVTCGKLEINNTIPNGDRIFFDDKNRCLIEFSIKVCILRINVLF
jgi:hypothetical protein